jgi:hypothetical protein
MCQYWKTGNEPRRPRGPRATESWQPRFALLTARVATVATPWRFSSPVSPTNVHRFLTVIVSDSLMEPQLRRVDLLDRIGSVPSVSASSGRRMGRGKASLVASGKVSLVARVKVNRLDPSRLDPSHPLAPHQYRRMEECLRRSSCRTPSPWIPPGRICSRCSVVKE